MRVRWRDGELNATRRQERMELQSEHNKIEDRYLVGVLKWGGWAVSRTDAASRAPKG